MTNQVCDCEACVLAGCQRPPVALGATKRFPARELHGAELNRFYEAQDAKKAGLWKVVKDYQAGKVR